MSVPLAPLRAQSEATAMQHVGLFEEQPVEGRRRRVLNVRYVDDDILLL